MQERKGGRSIADLEWQRQRFRTHIRAAQACRKPLVIHNRAAAQDTLAILREEGEDGSQPQRWRGVSLLHREFGHRQGGVGLGFFISFSGIVTFKNARICAMWPRMCPWIAC